LSIIYDALKKVEKAFETNTKVVPGKKDGKAKPQFKLYLIYAIVVCLGLFIANGVFVFSTQPKKTIAKPLQPALTLPQTPAEATLPKITKIEPPEARKISLDTKRRAQSDLILTGIFFSGEEGFALINNHIVKVGEVVGGAKVLRITLDEVELETAQGLIKLTVSSRAR